MKRKLTDDQERELRRRFFKLNVTATKLCAEFGISRHTLLKITGGSAQGRGKNLEHIYQ